MVLNLMQDFDIGFFCEIRLGAGSIFCKKLMIRMVILVIHDHEVKRSIPAPPIKR